jgi:hypothetical protein
MSDRAAWEVRPEERALVPVRERPVAGVQPDVMVLASRTVPQPRVAMAPPVTVFLDEMEHLSVTVVLRGVTARRSEKVGHRGRGLRVVRVQRRVEMRPRAATGPPLVATVRQGARGGHPERVRLRAGMATRRVVGFRAGMVLRVVTALLPHAVLPHAVLRRVGLPHVMAPPVVMALPVASARLREAVARRVLVAHRAEPMIGARPA